GEHRDGHRRRVDAALRLGLGHALHAVHAGLELELRIGASARDARDDLAIAAVLAGIRAQDLDAPALALRVAAVHPEQVAREDRGLVAAGARADLEEQVRVVVGVFRHEMAEQRLLARVAARAELAMLVFRELAELGVVALAQLLGRRDIGFELPVALEVLRDLGEARVLLRKLAKALFVGDCRGLTEQSTDFLVALDQRDELVAQRVLHLAACGGCSRRIRGYGALKPPSPSDDLMRASRSLRALATSGVATHARTIMLTLFELSSLIKISGAGFASTRLSARRISVNSVFASVTESS